MNHILEAVNNLFAYVVTASNFLWNFPTQFSGYANIPILGQFTLPVLLLLGAGIFFTFRTKFVQIHFFKKGIKILFNKKASGTGISPFASFMLSTAMRVGAGNIVGVTGAISLGGPGALFWMWVSAFFGMATSFVEATLSQLFKEKKGNEYVGGLTHYGQVILGNKRAVGVFIAVMFLLYRLTSVPIHTFHLFTATASIVDTITGTVSDRQSTMYYILAVAIVVLLGVIVFGGIRRVTAFTDRVVPVMAVGYMAIILIIVIANIHLLPKFIVSVVQGAFKPEAIFGGFFGVALIQGIKRGLLSNEAGMGTTSMAAASADCDHPVEQGFIQAVSVFLDTFVICSLTAFVIILASLWQHPEITWETLSASKIDLFIQSVGYLMPGTALDKFAIVIVSVAYGLFGFTTLLGGIVFCEISATKITGSKKMSYAIRILGVFVFVPLGCLSVLAGLQLDNVWGVSDFNNVIFVFINVVVILFGAKYAFAALKDYIDTDGKPFTEDRLGLKGTVWTKDRH